MPISQKWEDRNLSEVLALISRISDIASADATILENVANEDDWSDSFDELDEMLIDIDVLANSLLYYPLTPEALISAGEDELLKWLRREDSTFDQYEETI